MVADDYCTALWWPTISLSLYLDSAALHFNFGPDRSLRATTEITLQPVLNRCYTLKIFIENEELELRRQENQTWTPAQRPYVPCFPTMHAR